MTSYVTVQINLFSNNLQTAILKIFLKGLDLLDVLYHLGIVESLLEVLFTLSFTFSNLINYS